MDTDTPKGRHLSSSRKTALATGILYLITFVTSIGGLLLYGPVLHNATYIIGSGNDTRILVGALLEIMLVVANISCAIVLFPVLKRQNEAVALAYVASRIVEDVIIAVGILSLLSVVSLRHAGASGADAASLIVAGRSLVAVHKWTFLLGPGLLGSGGTGVLVGYLMYRSGLVPRKLAMLGLVGGPLVVLSGVAVLFGAYTQGSTWSGLATLPEILWEGIGLGIWLIIKGFAPSPIISGDSAPVGVGQAWSPAAGLRPRTVG